MTTATAQLLTVPEVMAGLDEAVRADVTSECLNSYQLPQPVESLIFCHGGCAPFRLR
ncbi:hypothetical protein ACFY1B_10180 [Streptomyces mirabilis]|uniref:hypothetical protein n=1 Tax=Streptomyces mirabilis TaxID=68239 RepID=UPI0036C0E509